MIMLGIFAVWALWGFIIDLRYRKRGGIGPTRAERILFWICLTVVVAVAAVAGVRAGSAELIGSFSVYLLLAFFCFLGTRQMEGSAQVPAQGRPSDATEGNYLHRVRDRGLPQARPDVITAFDFDSR